MIARSSTPTSSNLATNTNSHPSVPQPCLHAGGFNCQQTDWGYDSTSTDREYLTDWSAKGNLTLLYNSKNTQAFPLVDVIFHFLLHKAIFSSSRKRKKTFLNFQKPLLR